MASKRSKFRMTLSSLQICRSKQTSALAPVPKHLVFSPFNHRSLEISYPTLPEPTPSTPTDLSGIWDAPFAGKTEEPESRNYKKAKFAASRFKKEEHNNKETLKARDSICSSSLITKDPKPVLIDYTMSKPRAKETSEETHSSNLSMDRKSIGQEIFRENINYEKSKGSYSSKKSGLEELISCIEDGKVDESYAVMKRSRSPMEDFKKSMMEMIVDKEMVEVDDLEQLLSCFLSLNSTKHHAAIVSAFTEV